MEEILEQLAVRLALRAIDAVWGWLRNRYRSAKESVKGRRLIACVVLKAGFDDVGGGVFAGIVVMLPKDRPLDE